MPDELINILNVCGDPISVTSGLLYDFWGELSRSDIVSSLVDFVRSLHTEAPIILSILLIVIAFLVCRFPAGMSRPLGVAFSALLGAALTLAYFPPEGATGIPPALIAAAVALVFALFHRLVSLVSFFFAFGAFAYVSAYTGYILGLGKEDVFSSLMVAAVAILLSLLLLPVIRILGVCLIGGASASLAIMCVIDFSFLFGDGVPAAFFVTALIVALLALRGYLKRRSAVKSTAPEG